jgi:hypothetical protein
MKKLIIRIAIGVAVLLVVSIVVIFISLNSIVKKAVETVGPRLTKVEVRLGGVSVSPLSGNGRLTGLFLGNPEGYKTASAITVGDIKVGLQPSSVLSDTLVLEDVNIQAPEITLEGNLNGNNLSKILSNLEDAGGADNSHKSDPPASTAKKSEKKFFVKDLLIKGGQIHVSFTTPLGGESATLPLPELHLENIGSRENGVTAAELSRQIMKPLLASISKAVAEKLPNLTKGVQGMGKNAAGQAGKAVEELKGLFKK